MTSDTWLVSRRMDLRRAVEGVLPHVLQGRQDVAQAGHDEGVESIVILSSDGRYIGHCHLEGSSLDIFAGIVISIAQAPETDAAIVLTDAWLDMQAQQIV